MRGGQPKVDLLYISYIEQRGKTADKGGGGGQFSAENHGRPLWKAPKSIYFKFQGEPSYGVGLLHNYTVSECFHAAVSGSFVPKKALYSGFSGP